VLLGQRNGKSPYRPNRDGKRGGFCWILSPFVFSSFIFSRMKTLFNSEAVSKGGRSGSVESPDKLINVTLGNPLVKGQEKRGPNPELLFAGAYAACYHGALINASKKLGARVNDSKVRALVSLLEDDAGGYHLAVELHAQLPGVDRAQAQQIMEEAHKTCPYSKALRGDAPVKLVID
jgi:osmotically inducible protein OsmC